MKSTMKWLAAAITVLGIALFVAQAQKPIADSDSDTRAFQTRMTAYFKAWSKTSAVFDKESAASFYTNSDNLFVWDVAPLKGYLGWNAYKTGVDAVYANFERFTLTGSDDLRLTRRGDVAWTTMTFHAQGKTKTGDSIDQMGRLTDIWERTQGKWRIVHEHSSVPISN